jgi:general secretion pathway protein G
MRIPALSRRSLVGSPVRAFTLLELMFVIIIIGVLGAIISFSMLGAVDKAKMQTTKTNMSVVKKALNTYRATYNAYPDTSVGLGVLIADKILEKMPVDGWEKPIEYYSPTQAYPSGFELISPGPDMVANTADDIRVTPDSE